MNTVLGKIKFFHFWKRPNKEQCVLWTNCGDSSLQDLCLKHQGMIWKPIKITIQENQSSSLAFISEKAMATHSSTLAWKIPWTEEPGRLRSMGSLRVGHDWATSLFFTFMHWRRQWQPTPALLPRESQGQQSLVGCRLWVRTELDTTEAT